MPGSSGQFLVSGEDRKKTPVTWGYVISCRCSAASSGFSHKLSMVSEVGYMICGVWSYVATWADIGYIVVKPVVVAGEVS